MTLRFVFLFLDVAAALQFRHSTNSANGTNVTYGMNFTNGTISTNIINVTKVANGTNAAAVPNGTYGMNFTDGTNGTNVVNVTNVANGTNAAGVPNGVNDTFAVVSICEGVSYCDVAHSNFKTYCDRHGYKLLFYDDPPKYSDRSIAWAKLKLMQDALENYSFVFWMDADSLFMNMTQTLTSLQPRWPKQLSMTGDKHCTNINSGHFMLKSGNWSSKFLEDAWNVWPKPETWMYEQASMLYVLTGNRSICRWKADLCCDATLVDEYDLRNQSEMNSYISDFKPGDFILHFAGEIASLKAPRMANYSHSTSTLFDKSPLMRKWSPRTLMMTYASLALASTATSNLADLTAFHKDVELELYRGFMEMGGMRFIPTQGLGGNLKATTAGTCTEDNYVPSVLEKDFSANVLEWTKEPKSLCKHLEQRHIWVQENLQGSAQSGNLIWSRLCKKGQSPQLIEPLAGILRDPRMICDGVALEQEFSIDWLLLANYNIVQQESANKKILFDAGGSRFMDAMNFFISQYDKHGITFDEVYVWEAEHQGKEAYWSGTPHEARQKWESRLTFYDGIPVSADKNSEHNPLKRILDQCRPEDFCAFKLDIDTPDVELPIVNQLLASEKIGSVLDEFFFEHHVSGLMQGYGWGENVKGTFADSYKIFAQMRKKGVRAHSWI